MALSSEIISQFVKSATPKKIDNKESVAYGTIRISDGKKYVRLDGSDVDTPITQAVAVSENDRVVVQIKNHTAYVTGNLTAPSPSATLAGLKVDQLDQLFVGYMHANYADINLANIEEARIGDAYIDCLNAYYASIGKAQIDVAEVTKLKVGEALVERLNTDYADITFANIDTAHISKAFTDYLDAEYLSVERADLRFATIEELTAAEASITSLSAKEAAFETATANNFSAVNADISSVKAGYAKIDFANIGDAAIERIFSDYGMIKDLDIVDGHITGELSAVTINGDLINANTIKADKLVVKGEDGLYYKLNVSGETVEAKQTDENSLDGSVITAKSITASKITVEDLHAFGATIGGFDIETHSLHSHSKSSLSSTAPGVFMDDSGQLNIGDNDDYIKYTKISGTSDYQLDISAAVIKLGTDKRDVEEEILSNSSLIQEQSNSLDELSSDTTSNLEAIKQQVQDNADSIDSSNQAIANVRSSLNAAQQELDTMSGFIEIDSSKATLELGDKSSPFGVRITNTEIDFKIDRDDGQTDVPAYVGIDTSDSKSRLYVERASFEEEIAFGNFVLVKHVVDGKTNVGIIRRGGN